MKLTQEALSATIDQDDTSSIGSNSAGTINSDVRIEVRNTSWLIHQMVVFIKGTRVNVFTKKIKFRKKI